MDRRNGHGVCEMHTVTNDIHALVRRIRESDKAHVPPTYAETYCSLSLPPRGCSAEWRQSVSCMFVSLWLSFNSYRNSEKKMI